MIFYKRIYKTLLLLFVMNLFWFNHMLSDGLHLLLPDRLLHPAVTFSIRFFLFFIIGILFMVLEIFPRYEKGLNARLQILAGGYELILTSLYALIAEFAFLWFAQINSPRLFWTNLIIAYLILLFHYLNGFWRTAFCSAQLGPGRRIAMFFLWWVFPVNLFLFYKWCCVVRRELITAKDRYLLDCARVQNAVCRTRYPVVMIHGIFFRDWQYLNYWGRIPKALKQNGATVFYGNQQSSLSVADSAAELKEELLKILEESGAEKLNLVAHSKGGLDSRYVISRLGMAEHIASLTTINTPHRGCQFADALLDKLPDWLIRYVALRYNNLFRALGDDHPDFLAGVRDLTASACARFNEEVPDAPNVYYQSVMSKMRNHRSAMFPLNISYLLVKKYEKDNDGLVSTASAPWGHFLGVLSAGKKGISHGDMIDLTHKDIRNFDVSEFYVKLFQGLKEKGF